MCRWFLHVQVDVSSVVTFGQTSFHILAGTGDCNVPLVESIPTDHVTLRGDLVAKPPERSEEGGKVAMGRV